mgnify:CR=1 FL=1
MTEYLHWFKYYQENPFGYFRSDLRDALNCSILSAPYRKKRIPLTDFMLKQPEKKNPSPSELKDKIVSIFGGMVKDVKS